MMKAAFIQKCMRPLFYAPHKYSILIIYTRELRPLYLFRAIYLHFIPIVNSLCAFEAGFRYVIVRSKATKQSQNTRLQIASPYFGQLARTNRSAFIKYN